MLLCKLTLHISKRAQWLIARTALAEPKLAPSTHMVAHSHLLQLQGIQLSSEGTCSLVHIPQKDTHTHVRHQLLSATVEKCHEQKQCVHCSCIHQALGSEAQSPVMAFGKAWHRGRSRKLTGHWPCGSGQLVVTFHTCTGQILPKLI